MDDYYVVESVVRQALGEKLLSVGGFAYGASVGYHADEPSDESRGLNVDVEILDAHARCATADSMVEVTVTTDKTRDGGFSCQRKNGKVAFTHDEFVGGRLIALKAPVKILLERLFDSFDG